MSNWHYDQPWSNKLALRDGRTTVLALEIGTHGAYLAQRYWKRQGRNQVNDGHAVGHEFARAGVLDGLEGAQDVRTAIESRKGDGWCCRRPNLDQGNRILERLDEGPQAGGIGSTYEDLPNTDPRAAGSFAKALRLAREHELPLMQVVPMTSYDAAATLGKQP